MITRYITIAIVPDVPRISTSAKSIQKSKGRKKREREVKQLHECDRTMYMVWESVERMGGGRKKNARERERRKNGRERKGSEREYKTDVSDE